MATTQPTPPPNPTTNSEETPSTTTQQPQEPVDPQTTNDSPATDSQATELRVPITSETATDLLILSESTNIGLIVGIVVIVTVVIIVTLTVLIIVTVLLNKFRKAKKGYSVKNVAVPTTTNEAYGLAHHSDGVEESIYNYPEVNLDTIEAKQNVAYMSNTESDVITEGNQAYATSIAFEKNMAYGPVTSVETADEYDYI